MRRELVEVGRDRRGLVLTLAYPMMMLVLYGYGIRYDVNNVPLVVVDRSASAEARLLVEDFTRAGYFHVVGWSTSYREAEAALLSEGARAALVIPRDFGAAVAAGRPVAVQMLIDGADANTATIAQGYLLAIVARYNEGRGRRGPPAAVQLQTRVWYNPDLESVNFIVPGMIAVIMMIVGAMMTALAIVKEKERGTMEQILVSPVHPLELMLGKIAPYMLLACVDLTMIVSAGYFVFGVPIRGRLLDLALFSLLYLFGALGLGVLVSTAADTMQSAMTLAFFVSLLPAVLLSGFVYPIENLPAAIRAVTYFFPGRYFVAAIRGIYLKGVSIDVLWPQALFLVVFAIVAVGLSVRRFRDTLE